MAKRFARTIRGLDGDRVRVLRDPMDAVLESGGVPRVYVTSSERDAASFSGRSGICAVLTDAQALKLAASIVEAVGRKRRKGRG